MKHLIISFMLLGLCGCTSVQKAENKFQYEFYQTVPDLGTVTIINGHKVSVKKTGFPTYTIIHIEDCPCRKAEK